MKKILFLSILFAVLGCASEMPECFRNAGAATRYDVDVPTFTQIEVSEGIEVVVSQGAACTVEILTGENMRNEISATVAGGKLSLRNNTSCNWVRDYNNTTIFVTAPDMTYIYSASQFAVRSSGVLSYPAVTLQSGLYSDTAAASFELDLDTDSLIAEDNGSSYFKISGRAANVTVHFYAGDARFDGSSLATQDLQVFHRSSNDIIASPSGAVTGTLYSTGNLVLKSQPASVQVERLYHGNVIYE